MRHISKSFPGVKALDDVGFSVAEGEVRALVGENGAGKSTLMKILNGNYKKDEGQILIDGKEVDITDPLVAAAHGISIIFQELNLVDQLSIAENIFAGRLSKGLKRVNWKEINRKAKELLDRIGFDADPRTEVGSLTVAGKQMVEIAKALSRDCRIILMDEPSATLTKKELNALFDIIRDLKKRGIAVIYISHRMEEIFEICETATVMRDGRIIGTVNVGEVSPDRIVEMMVGREVSSAYPRRDTVPGEEILRVENLCRKDRKQNVSFSLRKGEVLGIAGVAGSGQRELLESIAGLYPVASGHVTFYPPDGGKEKELVGLDPMKIRKSGISMSFVPEDRLGMGLVGSMGMTGNMMLRSWRKGKGLFLNRKDPEALANRIWEELGVVTPSTSFPVRRMSGGNVQKVLVGREIAQSPAVLMTAYAVRGLDINTSYTIYNLLTEQKMHGVAVVYVGEDLDVLLELCDRIVVLCGGQVSGVVDTRKTDKREVGALMTLVRGGNKDE